MKEECNGPITSKSICYGPSNLFRFFYGPVGGLTLPYFTHIHKKSTNQKKTKKRKYE